MTGSLSDRFHEATDRAAAGGPEKYHEKLKTQGKLFVRDRVDLLCDPGSFVEDGLLANAMTDGHGADAVVTGRGTIDPGLRVALPEPFDAATGVDHALLARVERVALVAELDVELLLSGTGLERVPARARDGALGVFGMDAGLHDVVS